MIPRATYRLQFNKDFTFFHAASLAGYFAKLGVSHIYASPVLTARSGSPHGYDVVDHSRVNPELGGEAGFRQMAATLRDRDIGIIVDIVPNHMAVGTADNAWWQDVLAKGRASRYADFFDIDWDTPSLEGRILAPFLEGSVDKCLTARTLKLERNDAGKLAFSYFGYCFPLREEDERALENVDPSLLSREQTASLLSRQHYELADWRDADARINWRRFFDITELAALRVDRCEVFEAVHAKTFALYAEDLIDGVRVDHVDGLADPRGYCRALRERFETLAKARSGPLGPAYIVVEKILSTGESLPDDWQVDGTTGYDFMNDVSALQHADDPAGVLNELWRRCGRRSDAFEAEEITARTEMVTTTFAAQLRVTARAFARASARAQTKGEEEEFRAALISLLAELRCYRSYATGRKDSPGAGPLIRQAVAKALRSQPGQKKYIDSIRQLLEAGTGDALAVDAIRRFNQLSASVAAKAVEDTAFYRYGRLLSRNDVGFDPRMHTLSVSEFHERAIQRKTCLPDAMLTTATHDHKRGEDSRARLAVLSEVPDVWRAYVEEWFQTNRMARPPGLHSADEYQLYQSLVGVWPVEGSPSADFADLPNRTEEWCDKFLREAKLRSSWRSPHETYESQFRSFVRHLLTAKEANVFRKSVDSFVARITSAAAGNSLVQLVLRCTLPGVADIYRGNEFPDFSLVDPDNRRPVNFKMREHILETLSVSTDISDWSSDRAKLSVVARLLNARRDNASLFRSGSYRPLTTSGAKAANVVAFARELDDSRLVVIVARHLVGLMNQGGISPALRWDDAEIVDGMASCRTYEDVLFGTRVCLNERMPVGRLLSDFPARVLLSVEDDRVLQQSVAR